MPITERQRAQRPFNVGGSDIAKILNLSQYECDHDLWLEKTGKLEPKPSSKPARSGNRFEDGLLQWLSGDGDENSPNLGRIRRNVRRVHPDKTTHIAVNLDAILVGLDEPMDAKTAGLYSPPSDDWGAWGTDEVPVEALCQVQAGIACIGDDCKRGHIGAFIGWRGEVYYEIPRNDDLIAEIEEACRRFWWHVENDTPPEGLPTLETVKRVIRKEHKETELPEELVAAWAAADKTLKAAEGEADKAKAAILAVMGDAEIGQAGRFGKVTYKGHFQRRLDTARLRQSLPDLYESYLKEPKLVRRWDYRPPKGETK